VVSRKDFTYAEATTGAPAAALRIIDAYE